jgi:hypothetical protein
MEWPSTVNGHELLLDEVFSARDGVTGLRAKCRTCDVFIGGYSMEDYPKYRLAHQAARNAMESHADEAVQIVH